ncbi:hypothetical protein BGZ94_002614 [Podila epigama]|nr:hypothetical protein BGZ94_002614 [Podila epigama]
MPLISTLLSSVQVDALSAAGTVAALFASYLVYNTYIYPTFLSPLRHMPGPPNESRYNPYRLPFLGNIIDILVEESGVPHLRWIEQYGSIVKYRGFFGSLRIFIADPKAIQHVFVTHSYDYIKPPRFIKFMSETVGHGVLLAEGDAHRKQRKMLNPAFAHKHIKEMVFIMAKPASTLARIWEERVDGSDNKQAEFDITEDLSRATLDIIGLAGFGYHFQALTSPDNELSQAYHDLFDVSSRLVQLFRVFIPLYNYLPFEHNLKRKRAIRKVDKVTTKLIADKRAQTLDKNSSEDDNSKDLMSILIRGNEQVGSLEGGKLTDTELKDQILTFLAAGHETTAVATTWMLYIFSVHQDVQARVRNELLTHIGRPTAEDGSHPGLTYDALASLPYLSACVKELLRFIPPVPATSRMARVDDQILGYNIPKGTEVFLIPSALHKLKAVWGEDADEYKPERWLDRETVVHLLGEKVAAKTTFVTPDMNWAYQPFLTGPRNCIGSKFALIEAKILLYHLLLNLEFHPSPGFTFKKQATVTWRPVPGMKLVIKRIDPSKISSVPKVSSKEE